MDNETLESYTQEIEDLKGEMFENYTKELDELKTNFDDLQNKYDGLMREAEGLRKVKEEYEQKIKRYKILLSTIFQIISGIILLFVNKSSVIDHKKKEIKKRKKRGETSKNKGKKIENVQSFENVTDSESEIAEVYADIGDEVGVFGRETMDELEVLKYIVSEMISENSALKFEILNYSKGIIKDYNMNYNYSKGVIRDRVGALLSDRFRLVWEFLMDNFGDRLLLPVFLVRDLLSHFLVIVMVINYLYYFHERILYCTIA
jgi:hypothetical protein